MSVVEILLTRKDGKGFLLEQLPNQVDHNLYEPVKVKIPQAVVRSLGSLDETLDLAVEYYNTTVYRLFLIVTYLKCC